MSLRRPLWYPLSLSPRSPVASTDYCSPRRSGGRPGSSHTPRECGRLPAPAASALPIDRSRDDLPPALSGQTRHNLSISPTELTEGSSSRATNCTEDLVRRSVPLPGFSSVWIAAEWDFFSGRELPGGVTLS